MNQYLLDTLIKLINADNLDGKESWDTEVIELLQKPNGPNVAKAFALVIMARISLYRQIDLSGGLAYKDVDLKAKYVLMSEITDLYNILSPFTSEASDETKNNLPEGHLDIFARVIKAASGKDFDAMLTEFIRVFIINPGYITDLESLVQSSQ